jgi:parallel beta-helix repeat protein
MDGSCRGPDDKVKAHPPRSSKPHSRVVPRAVIQPTAVKRFCLKHLNCGHQQSINQPAGNSLIRGESLKCMNNIQSWLVFGGFAFASFAGWSPLARAQGSLLPPGPPAPTMKTLEQIEPRRLISALPFTVTASGSYYLTTNLTGTTGQNGIVIQADDVTLDLNGFTLRGVTGSSNGIVCLVPHQNLAVSNGAIRNWGTHGIDAAAATGSRFERLTVSGNGGSGLRAGDYALVDSCVAMDNTGDGLQIGPSAIVRKSQASQNRGSGIVLGPGGNLVECNTEGNLFDGIVAEGGSRIQASVSRQNLGHGLSGTTNLLVVELVAQQNESRGISVGDGAVISGTSAVGNGETGIYAENAARITDCTARGNAGDGIRTGSTSEVASSVAQANRGRGITTGGGSGVVECLSAGNTGVGIQVEHTARVRDCTAQGNIPGGISVGKGSTVTECSAQDNGGDGIRVSTECLVVGNHCHGNDNVVDSAGIHATGTKNQIRDNSVTSNVRGISLDVDGNFVARNLASNNTLNYRRTQNQTMGNVLTTLDAASSEQAWANFAF